MRLFLVTLCVFAWALPSARAVEVSTTWNASPDEIEFVAPSAQAASIALTTSRSDSPDAASGLATRAASPTQVFAATACDVAAAPAVPHGVTRWILGHATTSAIP